MESESGDSSSENSSLWDNSDDCNSDSDDDSLENARIWCRLNEGIKQTAPPVFPFTGKPGFRITVPGLKEPVDYFQSFFDNEIMDHIVCETNRFADQFIEKNELTPRSRAQDWKATTVEEMFLFLAILLYEGIIKKPVENWYWTRQESIATPFISQIMPRKRFELIMKFLHFSNNESFDERTHPQPKLRKVYDLFQLLCNKFKKNYVPERCIAVDESLVPYKGRLSYKQYIPKKRARFGIKIYELCESTSAYIWNMIIYTGNDTPYDSKYAGYGASIKIVMTLIKDILGQGYLLYLDNFYSSVVLAELLIAEKTDVCGTLRLSRKYLPPAFKCEKVTKGKMISFQKGKMCILKWQDKKTVSMLTTIHTNDMAQIEPKYFSKKRSTVKPKAVLDYNIAMGGVDKADQCMAYYPCIRNQQRKYYKKVFRHLLDMAVWNSYVLYKKDGGKIRHVDFRLQLFEGLVKKYTTNECKASNRVVGNELSVMRLSGRHWHFPTYVKATPKNKNPCRRCAVCSQQFEQNGKRKRKESRYQCEKCDVGLCVSPCFEIFHTLDNF